ncbi:MAG: hypothetical protein NZT92_09200 [Abditibacteriales bacterium]|nr:hypothetical protein [Abditibacteriales bacterium]MDW8364559.1 glycoside hydrolase [Abditibacteriales bacterium]
MFRRLSILFALMAMGWQGRPPLLSAQTTAKKQGEVYVMENERLRVAVNPIVGSIAVRDKVSGYDWRQPNVGTGASATPRFRNVRTLPNGVAFEADFGVTRGKPNTVIVSLTLPPQGSDLVIDADMADRHAEVNGFAFLEPFVLDTPKGVLAVADYSNGHLYPLDLNPLPRSYFDGGRLDLPFVGVCDLERGMGYAMILETSDDAAVRCNSYPISGRSVAAPQVIWHPSQGRFAYPRRLIYRFTSSGGYVALAKAYRAYAKEQGLLVTLAEKLQRNPNLRRLFGAPDVWGDASLKFAREAKAAGVDKMLIHGRASPQDMKAINELGYLTSEYDNYTDILPVEEGKEIDSNHDKLPDAAVLKADGQRMTAWLTWDKKTQYMKRCPSLWVNAAKVVIPKVLQTHPFLGRFIDVTTAEGLYECYDEKHPLTKAQKRQCGPALLGFVRAQNLVVGGEHGIWWAVPYLDYIEGMMSGGFYSWPAGYLIRPKSKDETFDQLGRAGGMAGGFAAYEKWGIGHEWRVPLWELVFHDCVVSTWYWGDASDWLLQAAPEVTPNKDAFNILYGTIPLLWANREGSWHTARDVFLRTYRNTCKLHEVIAGTEMLSHEFVTPDHAVQRTKFSDGTTVIVNFGEKPYTAELGGRKYILPQNGFAVKGPRIEQSLALVDGKPVTTIRQQGYFFTDAGGVELTVRAVGEDHLRVVVGNGLGAAPITFRPTEVVSDWDIASTRAFLLDTKGQRVTHVVCRRSGPDSLILDSRGGASLPALFDIVCRSKVKLPDLRLDAVAVNPTNPKQGERINVSVILENGGGGAAQEVEVAFYADAVQSDRQLARRTISITAGEQKTVAVRIDTSPMDGTRRIIAVADSSQKAAELCERNNAASRAIEVTPDFSRWQHRRTLRVEAGELDREDEPIVVPMELRNVDPASVRVVECDEQGDPKSAVPAQFDVSSTGQGELCFLLRGKTPARTARRFLVLWAENRNGLAGTRRPYFAPPATMWHEADKAILAETYRAEFDNGTLTNIATRSGKPFISHLMLSSRETGWTEEPGTVERFEVLHAGPVRTVIWVRKALNAGVVYEKTYTFYPRRFDVSVSVNKPAGGLYSRAYYLQRGTYLNDQNARATVDGRGEGENVSGTGKKWYAVIGDGWAHACLALSSFDHIAYWDGGYWGGIGLVTSALKNVRMSYVIPTESGDETFAEREYQRLASPVKVGRE